MIMNRDAAMLSMVNAAAANNGIAILTDSDRRASIRVKFTVFYCAPAIVINEDANNTVVDGTAPDEWLCRSMMNGNAP